MRHPASWPTWSPTESSNGAGFQPDNRSHSSAGGICRAAPSQQQHGRRHWSHERAEFGKPVVGLPAISPPRRPPDEVRRLMSDGSQADISPSFPPHREEKKVGRKKSMAGWRWRRPRVRPHLDAHMQASRFQAGSWVSRASMPRRPTGSTKTTTTGLSAVLQGERRRRLTGQAASTEIPRATIIMINSRFLATV